MKKLCLIVICAILVFSLIACSPKTQNGDGLDSLKEYHELEDGTWECEGRTYKYRFEISGRMSSAAKNSTFVYLTNLESISFSEAWKAAGFSSFSGDYFAPEDAVLVEAG
jgi:hypothetical protein